MRLRPLFIALLLTLSAAAHASAQAGLRETFGDGQDGPAGGIGPGSDLLRKTVDQNVFPRARCNDNSPAIFYYRPATRPQDADKWLIHLQGGGSCGTGMNCAERWFSVNTNFGARNMTSEGFPAGTGANGIFDKDNPTNPFAGFNHVYVHYCSSDTWAGTRENVPLVGIDYGLLAGGEGLPCAEQYTISFLGRPIFDAVIDTLRRNGVPPTVYAKPDEPARLLPDLDTASVVVLSGGSGGGMGVINNLDHLRSTLPGEMRVVGLTDSAFRPSKEGMDLSQTSLCVSKQACDVVGQNKWDYEEGSFHLWGAKFGSDDSCFSYHTADPYQCADTNHILTDHVTTPYFVRMDLIDKNAVLDYQEQGIFIAGTPDPEPGTPEHEPLSEQEFAEASRRGILALAVSRRTAHEPGGVEPGAFAPACRQHDELRNDAGVYRTSVRGRGGRLEMFDVFRAWVDGRRPAILAADSPNDSVCPPQ